MADGKRRREVTETYDLGLGFVGFFAVAFFGIVVFLELTGHDAVWAAFTTFVLGAILFALWLARRRHVEKAAEEERLGR